MRTFTLDLPADTLTVERDPHRLGLAFADYLLSAFEKAEVPVAPDRRPPLDALCRELGRRVVDDRLSRRPVAVTRLLAATAVALHRAFRDTAPAPIKVADVLLSFVRLVLEDGLGSGRRFDPGQPDFRERVVNRIRAEDADGLSRELKRFFLPPVSGLAR